MRTLTIDDITRETVPACKKCLEICDVYAERGTIGAGMHEYATPLSFCCDAPVITAGEAAEIKESIEPDVIEMQRDYEEMEAA